jgi:hypothetical protein
VKALLKREELKQRHPEPAFMDKQQYHQALDTTIIWKNESEEPIFGQVHRDKSSTGLMQMKVKS